MRNLVGLDVIVVGGGVAGVCTAYFLQRSGMQVTLLERASVGGNAPQVAVKDSLGEDRALNDQDFNLLAEVVNDMGYSFETPEADDPAGALSAPSIKCKISGEDVLLSKLVADLSAVIQDRGARVFEAVEVDNLIINSGKVVGVFTNSGPFLADEVVISTVGLSAKFEYLHGLDLGAKHYSISAFHKRQDSALTSARVYDQFYVGRPDEVDGTIVAVGHRLSPVSAFNVGFTVSKMVSRPWEQQRSGHSCR